MITYIISIVIYFNIVKIQFIFELIVIHNTNSFLQYDICNNNNNAMVEINKATTNF